MRHLESKLPFRPPAASARPARRFWRFDWLVAGVCAALLAGCATGEYSLVATVSGGAKVRVPIGRGGPVSVEEDGVRIVGLGLRPDADKKKVLYSFIFSDARSRALKNVKVEDISDETPFLLVDDTAPQLVKGRWLGDSPAFAADDSYLKWVFQVDNSMRVIRFTITFADGHTLVINQGSAYPDFMKSVIRHMFGEKY